MLICFFVIVYVYHIPTNCTMSNLHQSKFHRSPPTYIGYKLVVKITDIYTQKLYSSNIDVISYMNR